MMIKQNKGDNKMNGKKEFKLINMITKEVIGTVSTYTLAAAQEYFSNKSFSNNEIIFETK